MDVQANRGLCVTVLLSCAAVGFAGLSDVTLAEFVREAPCGMIVAVKAVQANERSIVYPESESRLEFVATVEVAERFGSCDGLDAAPASLNFFFSSEVHSSHPERGQTALLFPKAVD